MDFDVSVVINQAQFSKFVHKKAHAGAGRRADHFRECLLADVGDDLKRTWLVALHMSAYDPKRTFRSANLNILSLSSPGHRTN
jgi:hypothetical protein